MGLVDFFRKPQPEPAAAEPVTGSLMGQLGYGPNLNPAPQQTVGQPAPESTTRHHHDAQQHIHNYVTGYNHHGQLFSGGSIPVFTGDILARLNTRMPRIIQKWDHETWDWRTATPEDEYYGRLFAWWQMYGSQTRNNLDLKARAIRFRHWYGEYWVLRFNRDNGGTGYYHEIVSPVHVKHEPDRNRILYTRPDRAVIEISERHAFRVLFDEIEPGVPHSPYFAMLDDLERIDCASAAIDRAIASAHFNRKVLAVNNGDSGSRLPDVGGGKLPDKTGTAPDPLPTIRGMGQKQSDFATRYQQLSHSAAKGMNKRNPSGSAPLLIEGVDGLNIVDPLVCIDPALFQALDDARADVARGSSFPTNFILDGLDQNHWSSLITREDVMSTTVIPEVEADDRAWQDQFARLEWRELGLMPNPEEWRIVADPTDVIQREDTFEKKVSLYQVGAIGRDVLVDAAGCDDEDLLELPEGMSEYEHWSFNRATGNSRTRSVSSGGMASGVLPTTPAPSASVVTASLDGETVAVELTSADHPGLRGY